MLQAVIIAGGKGTRLGMNDIPKPMVEIDGKPLLQHQIELAKRFGINEFFIMSGYLSEVIINYFGTGEKYHWRTFLPELRYTTDNAAMIGLAAYHKYLAGQFAGQNLAPRARYSLQEYFGK